MGGYANSFSGHYLESQCSLDTSNLVYSVEDRARVIVAPLWRRVPRTSDQIRRMTDLLSLILRNVSSAIDCPATSDGQMLTSWPDVPLRISRTFYWLSQRQHFKSQCRTSSDGTKIELMNVCHTKNRPLLARPDSTPIGRAQVCARLRLHAFVPYSWTEFCICKWSGIS